MTIVRPRSGSEPRFGPEATASAIDLLRVAQAMGLDTEPPPSRLDLGYVRRIARSAAAVGIGRDPALALRAEPLPVARIPGLIDRLTESLRASPLPRQELERLGHVLDLDTIGRYVGASPVSLRRYLAGTRDAPDDIAARVHWLALTVSDLLGAYNEIGVRRWFERPRSGLNGRTPAELLAGAWDPDGPDARAIRTMASALVLPGGAA
jgi:hypothetical protein